MKKESFKSTFRCGDVLCATVLRHKGSGVEFLVAARTSIDLERACDGLILSVDPSKFKSIKVSPAPTGGQR